MRIASVEGLAGSALALATTVLYLALIASEANDNALEVAPWAAAFAATGVLAAIAAWTPGAKARSIVFAATAGANLALGILALFSIGILLIGSGVLLAVAAARAIHEVGAASAIAAPLVIGVATFLAAPAVMLALT